jgi:4-amino-4-deoxy-L-arabinose transferase-like glycosyltransferase
LSATTIGIIACFFVLGYALFFFHLGSRELVSSHEARAAQDAESIILDHRWDLPALFDRKIELQKPPLYYWMVAAVSRLRGTDVDAISVRIPSALAAVGGAVVVALLCIHTGRRVAAVLAAFSLVTMLHYTWLGRVGRIDMPLTLMTTISLVGFYLAERTTEQGGARTFKWLALAYVAMSLGMLLKGPIGFVLPAAVMSAWLLAQRRLPAPWRLGAWWALGREWGVWWGGPLAVLIVVPWYVWANAQTGGAFFSVFFWKHNFERGFGGGSLAAHPWWFYAARLAMDLFPWSIVLAGALWVSLKRGWWRVDREARFGLIWLLTVLLVLSCSRFKRSDYLLPAYPAAALFIGCALEQWYFTAVHKRRLALGVASLVFGYTVLFMIFVGIEHPSRQEEKGERQFAAEVRRRAPAPQLILFFRTEAHALAFHVGRPIDTILEWENLQAWVARPEIYHIVMPSEYAAQWREHLRTGGLKEVTRSHILGGSTHSDPLVLMRTHPEAESPVP